MTGCSNDTSTKAKSIALNFNVDTDADAHRDPQQGQIIRLNHSNVYVSNENDYCTPKSKKMQSLQNWSQASYIKGNKNQRESDDDHTVAGPLLAAGAIVSQGDSSLNARAQAQAPIPRK